MDRYSSKYDRFIGGKNAVAKNFSHRRVEHSATILRPADAFLRGRKKRRDVSVKWQRRGIQGGVAKERERNAGLHGCETSRWACVAALPTLRIRGSSHSPRWLDEISFAIVCDRLKKQYDDEEEKDTFSRNFHPYIWRRN